MRNYILIFVLLFAFGSCQKDKNSGNAGIVIKGRISGNIKSSGTKGLSLTDAKKVFVVTIDNGMLKSEFLDITDNSFTATSAIGLSAALVFLDADNKYIGTLSSHDLNLLPLGNLIDGENTTIDLADLTLSGTTVTPSHDPLGDEIVISDGEINRLKEIDGFFEALAKNIDANNDNILDVLNDKQLFIKTRFWVQASHWGLNGTTPSMSDIDINSLSYEIELDGSAGFSKPTSIVMTGPADSPYNDITTHFINSNGNAGFYSGISRDGELFKKGTYSINIDGYTCTMDYSNIDASHNHLFVLPTLHTNSEGKLTSISLEYKLPNGTTVDPINIMTDVMIQFTDEAGNQFFTSPWLKNENASIENCTCASGVFSYSPSDPIDITNLTGITIPYNDLLGNTYFISWRK
jgi:hypothetical protein